ncbi:hypothetical protein O59_004198 [Cellvibrio sp. BR]|uniref:ribonuclease HI n=1 Tax=Cellvibrio sp. BR TaxID=1134474 RepID=UPI000260098A|nr:RNase H family protein [Cellvibrio sp. BR]EIK43094.1 hypothetical protein O59_004198 [Cellvibrio sp. BR]
MPNLMLFTDGSVDTKTRVGFGAYLAVENIDSPLSDLLATVKVKPFENTSSTRLELQTLLWAINEVLLANTEQTQRVIIYSDSQNIVGLPARRAGLEQRDYCANSGKRLNNADLYQQFYGMMDRCTCTLIKLDGHKPAREKDTLDKVYALVDKTSRAALRHFNHPRMDYEFR